MPNRVVQPEERISRFLFDPGHFSKPKMEVKAGAFEPRLRCVGASLACVRDSFGATSIIIFQPNVAHTHTIEVETQQK